MLNFKPKDLLTYLCFIEIILNSLLDELEQHNIISQLAPSNQINQSKEPIFSTRSKLSVRETQLKSFLMRDISSPTLINLLNHGPLNQSAKTNRQLIRVFDLLYESVHGPLDKETIRFVNSNPEKTLTFISGFYGLKGRPIFFRKQKYSFLQKTIDQGFYTCLR